MSGTRVVAPGKTQDVGGVKFQGFGASHEAYPTPYFTAAAALGTTREEVDVFCARLAKCFADFRKRRRKRARRRRRTLEVAEGDDGDGTDGVAEEVEKLKV